MTPDHERRAREMLSGFGLTEADDGLPFKDDIKHVVAQFAAVAAEARAEALEEASNRLQLMALPFAADGIRALKKEPKP